MTTLYSGASSWTPPWDHGISWRSELVTPPALALDIARVRDKVLRVANDDADDEHIENLIRAATDIAEQETQRAIREQTWKLILSGFPSGPIVLPRPPLIAITSVTYVDGDGDEQSLSGSPAEYVLSPSGFYRKARIAALTDAEWPSTREQADAVTITFRCGFEDLMMAPAPSILTGIELAVAQLYDTGEVDVEKLRPFWRMVVDA